MKSQTITLEEGKMVIIDDLSLTNMGGGHDIMEDGSDPSSFDLLVQTPREKEHLFMGVFENTLKISEGDLVFGVYIIRVNHVAFDAETVNLTVTKKEIF